jgi:hypothetical protein
MLTYTSLHQLRGEPEPVRFLHLTILTALRDGASQLEVRFGDDAGLLYQRVDGRDWELAPPAEEVYPLLKDAVRAVARLVRPERPEITFTGATTDGARIESPEVGWLTYRLADHWIDLLVQIDPREPGGFIRIETGGAEMFAAAAADALNEYYESEEVDS